MKKEKEKFTVLRVRLTTMDRFNYKRSKAVTLKKPRQETQDEFLNTLLDKFA